MPKAILIMACVLLGMAAGTARAQLDCRVLLTGSNTAAHEGNITVAPSSPVTLQAHCDGAGTPTYQWTTGATSSSINVSAPAAAGGQQGYQVTITRGGNSGTFTGIVRSAATGTPTCTLTRVPAGTVQVFTNVTITATCPGATSYTWTGGYDLRGQGTSEVVHVNVLNEPNAAPVVIDVIPSNASGAGAAIGTAINYTVAPPACRIVAEPSGTVAPGTTVNLIAQCDGAATSYSWQHGDLGSSILVSPGSTTTYTLNASNGAGSGAPALHTVAVGPAPGLRDYTGHWYGGPSQDGWGITLNQHGDTIFGVIYFYDATGEPTWAVLPDGTWNANFTAYSGVLYQPIGTPYTGYNASQLIAGAPTGSITLTFNSPDSMTASYELGYSQWDPSGPAITTFGQKSLVPLIKNSGTNPSGINVADMWWGGPSQNGWGMSINQRSSEIFAAWFTYGADRRPTWFIVSGDQWSGNTVGGAIYRVTGDPWLGMPYDPAVRQVTVVGAASLPFADAANGTFNYNIGGAGGTKPITRQSF